MENFQEAIKYLRDEAYQLSQQDRDEQAAEMLAAADKLAATPAPASDEVLAELEGLLAQATPAPWTVWLGHGTIFYGEAEINEAYQYSPANLRLFEGEDHDRQEALEDGQLNIQPGEAEDDARLVAALRNAATALLARVRQAESFKAQVVKVLAERREQAFADFTANVEDSTGEPIPGAEAGEEINKIIQLLGLTVPATQAVKGGPQDA